MLNYKQKTTKLLAAQIEIKWTTKCQLASKEKRQTYFSINEDLKDILYDD